MPKVIRGNAAPILYEAAKKNRHESTEAEKDLWEELRNRKLGGLKFRKQHPVGGYVLDFFCVDEMLAIEVDGSIHDDPEQKGLDQERTLWLNEQEIRVLRFTNESILDNLPSVLDQIKSFVINTPLRRVGH